MSGDAWALTSPGSARDLETDHEKREDDPTPRGVVRAAIEAATLVHYVGEDDDPRQRIAGDIWGTHPPDHVVRVLDVCAGYGCWASELRRLAALQSWPVHITGVELFEPRRPDLAKWCDEVVIGEWKRPLVMRSMLRAGANPIEVRGWDIAIGNPHFTALAHEDPAQSMPAVLLEHAPAVLLLHTQQAFARGEAGRRVWRAYPPAASWIVPGSVKFRTGLNPKCPKCKTVNVAAATRCGRLLNQYAAPEAVEVCGEALKPWGSDSRCYQVSLWLRGHEGPTSLHLLPELDAAARRWTVAPGSEQPSPELPAAPGWAP